jgi:hypothetical protein
MAAGVRIFDMSIILDIEAEVKNNPHYLAAAHILDWGPRWYELHQQFVLVNTSNWRKANRPPYGGWTPETTNLPVIERSPENFHDDYTPLWIKFTGEWVETNHSHPGWNFLLAAAQHHLEIVNWNHTIRSKRTYYYPENNSDQFLESLNTLTNCGITNPNQVRLITQLQTVGRQIWLLNSEYMHLQFPPNLYTVALTASGFKFLEVYNQNLLAPGGQLIIYDFNPLSLEWIRVLHTSSINSIDDIAQLILNFPHREQFKVLGGDPIPRGSDGRFQHQLTRHFWDSMKRTVEYYGTVDRFIELVKQWQASPVRFVEVNMFDSPHTLTQHFRGQSAINISNIYCTDWSNATLGVSETRLRFQQFIDSITTPTTVVGHDPDCEFIVRKVN